MDIYLWFILLFVILCFSALFLSSIFSRPKAKAPGKMKMNKENSVESHSKMGGANKMTSIVKREFLGTTGFDKVNTESNHEKYDKVRPGEKAIISASRPQTAATSSSIRLSTTNAAGSIIKEREKATELRSKRLEEKTGLNLVLNRPTSQIDEGRLACSVKSVKTDSLRKSTKTSTKLTSIFDKSPPRKIERNLLPLFQQDTGSTTHNDVTAFRSLDEQTIAKPEIGISNKENINSDTAKDKPCLVGVVITKQENTHEAPPSLIKTTSSFKEEHINQTLVYNNVQRLNQGAAKPTDSIISKPQSGFGVPVANVNQTCLISAPTIPLGGACAARGNHLKEKAKTKDFPSHMDTDEEDKEKTNIVGASAHQHTFKMEEDELHLNSEAPSAQNIQSMDVEGPKRYTRRNKTLKEENMISDSYTETDNDGMIVEEAKYEQYIDADYQMADVSIQKTKVANNKFLSSPLSVINAKPTLLSKVTLKADNNKIQTLCSKTNHSFVSNQPLANDNPQCYRKTFSRVTLENNQKVFVKKEIPVLTLPNSKQANQTVVGVKFRSFQLPTIQGERAPKEDTLSMYSPGMLQTTKDCALKKEAKRIIDPEQCVGFEKDLDNTMKKKKKVSMEPPVSENKVLLKRKERCTLLKSMMKIKLKSVQPKDVDFSTDMDFNSTEAGVSHCDICSKQFLFMECTWCPYNHKICFSCIKEVIKNALDNKKLCLECPREVCQATISLDLLSKMVDPVTVEILERKLLKRLEKTQAENFESLYDTISCAVCQNQIILDPDRIHVICKQCNKEMCSYCQQTWNNVSHHECSLLSYSGQRCFTNYHELPANWVKQPAVTETNQTVVDVESFTDVDLKSGEGKAVIRLFTASMTCKVTSIRRVQTIKLWEKYALKRRHMVDELGLPGIKERALFHGTESSNISLICQEGFDMRVKTVNGSLYGKGIYFSTNSRYSHDYAKGSHTMFISRVLCGNSTLGNKDMFRPPKDASGRLYDTCVNDKQSIYVVFDNAQCFPAYVITYGA